MEIAKIREAVISPAFARDLVEKILSRIKHGHLLMKRIDGSEISFGDLKTAPVRVEIRDEKFYNHCLFYGDIGFGEAYVEGWWTTTDLYQLLRLIINNMHELGGLSGSERKMAGNLLKFINRGAHLLRSNTITGAKKNIQEHYDLSNDFYKLWLDPSMTYSSALWTQDDLTLEEAQREKWKSLAENLELKGTDHLLEIGTGWGGFACFAAKEYGCRIDTYTISKEQHKYAQELFKREGVEHLITLHLEDYRNIQGTFDKIVSIEMMEAIGHEYFPTFFKVLHQHLKPQGLVSYQVITCPDSRYDEYRRSIDWIQKHIFPGALLPSVGHLMTVINEVSDMQLLKFRDFGPHYARTLRMWDENFKAVKDKIQELGFDEKFQRKWHYYLKYCEAAFDARNISVVQMTLTRPNNTQIRPFHG
jgi:cyclopropane-fatty-acyl-phospholipid synthase